MSDCRGIAKTYEPVAVGLCTRCRREKQQLRFVYDSYDPEDLELFCLECGEVIDENYRDGLTPT